MDDLDPTEDKPPVKRRRGRAGVELEVGEVDTVLSSLEARRKRVPPPGGEGEPVAKMRRPIPAATVADPSEVTGEWKVVDLVDAVGGPPLTEQAMQAARARRGDDEDSSVLTRDCLQAFVDILESPEAVDPGGVMPAEDTPFFLSDGREPTVEMAAPVFRTASPQPAVDDGTPFTLDGDRVVRPPTRPKSAEPAPEPEATPWAIRAVWVGVGGLALIAVGLLVVVLLVALAVV